MNSAEPSICSNGAHLDTGLLHRDEQVRDAGVLGRVGVGAGQQEDVVGVLGLGGPHLLAVDDPLVAVELGPGLQAGQVRSGVGLAEALAPRRSSPLRMLGMNCFFCSSVPHCRRVGPTRVSPKKSARSGAPARANSSFSTTCWRSVRPLPPYSVGQLAQIHPPAKSLAVHSLVEGGPLVGGHGEPRRTPALGQVLRQPSADDAAELFCFGGVRQVHAAARYPPGDRKPLTPRDRWGAGGAVQWTRTVRASDDPRKRARVEGGVAMRRDEPPSSTTGTPRHACAG